MAGRGGFSIFAQVLGSPQDETRSGRGLGMRRLRAREKYQSAGLAQEAGKSWVDLSYWIIMLRAERQGCLNQSVAEFRRHTSEIFNFLLN